MKDCSRGFAIQAGDNGWVENVMISNIVMETKMFAGAWWGKGEPLVISAANSDSARIRGISINHVRSRAENSILIVGQNHNVSDITLNDVQVTYSYSPNTPLYGQKFDLAPAPLRSSFLNKNHMPWLYADSVSGLDARNVSYRQADSGEPKLSLEPVITNVDRLDSSPAK
jgi:hypothetical protein